MGEAKRRKDRGILRDTIRKPDQDQLQDWLNNLSLVMWARTKLQIPHEQCEIALDNLLHLLMGSQKDGSFEEDAAVVVSLYPHTSCCGVDVKKWVFWVKFGYQNLSVAVDYPINVWGEKIVPELLVQSLSSVTQATPSPAPKWAREAPLRAIWQRYSLLPPGLSNIRHGTP